MSVLRGVTPEARGDESAPDSAFSVVFPGVVGVSLVALTLTEQFAVLPGAMVAFGSAYLLLRER
ncbi:hypothetical protein [Nocardioides sp. P5_C9_2]